MAAYAQPTGTSVDYYQVHYGEVNGVDLTGYITYHVYIDLTNEDDFVTSIYGLLEGDPSPDDIDLTVTTDCDCFNETQFSGFSAQASSFLLGVEPLIDFDTYWTIGKRFTDEPGMINTAVAFPAGFNGDEDPCSFQVDDGTIFTTLGQPNGVAGPDNRVLIMQVTTCADEFTIDYSALIFENGIQGGDNSINYEPDPVTFENPCVANALPSDFTTLEEILCQGETATIDVNAGGNGNVTYDLYTLDGTDTTLINSQTAETTFEDLLAGDYFIAMVDEVGCRDTIQDITFTDPPGLNVTVNFTQDNLCGGEDIAEICPEIVGGQPPYTVTIDGPAGYFEEINAGECFSNLSCADGDGLFTVTVSDQSGCSYTEDVTISCPEELVVTTEIDPILCNGDGNASISVDATGGTGILTVDLDVPDFTFDPATAPWSFEVTDVVPGTYTLTVTDENNCVHTEELEIVEPAVLEVEFTDTDVQCSGDCDGTITFEAVGGTPPYTLIVTDGDGNTVDADALCAGEYTAVVTDDNGCEVTETLEITEPDLIAYEVESTDISCFGAGDGQICISNVAGGTGEVQWQISSPPTESTELGTEPCFGDLSSDIYVITFEDENGCVVTETGIVLDEPDALEITAEPTAISCFGFNDGLIDVSATGGTGEISLTAPEMNTLPASIENLPPGIVNVVIMDASGCQDSVEVEILEPTAVSIDVLQVNDITCGGDCNGSAEIDLSGGTGELALLLNGLPSTPIGLCAGEYEAIVIDENTCQDTAFFEIIQPDPIEFLINIDQVTCTGMNDGSVNIFPTGGVGPLTWELIQDVDINNLFEGEYTVVAEDSTGCTADSTFIVTAEIETDMEVEVFTSPVTCWNESDGTATAAVTGGTLPISYQWNDPNNQVTATAIGLSEEVYSVTVTDAIGCTLSFTAEVEPTEGCFFIADALTPNGDGANDEWVIGGLEFFPNSLVQVYNRWGQLLFESRGYNTRWDGTWNGSQLPVADYYYVITYDETQEPITGTVTIKY